MATNVIQLPDPRQTTPARRSKIDLRKGWGADVAALYDGTYRMTMEPQGRSGVPQTFGAIRLEQNPDLHPAIARGAGKPGIWWDLANSPQVEAAFQKPIRAISGTTFRLEEVELPPWATADDKAAAAVQYEYASRVWSWLGRLGGVLDRIAYESIWTTGTMGFCWYEISADKVDWKLEGLPRRSYWRPRLHWRAPWTVRYWLTQAEQLRGVVADFSRVYEWRGQHISGYTVIPAEKILHIAPLQLGSNFEGRSWLRPIRIQLEMLRQAIRLQALGYEIVAIGEVFFLVEKDTMLNDDDIELLTEYVVNRKAGNISGAILPAGVTVMTTKPSDTVADLGDWINQLERQVYDALDASDKVIAAQQHGSYAARETASADARDSFDYIAEQYVARPLMALLERMLIANFPGWALGGMIFTPKVAWGVVEERDNSKYLADLIAAATAGLVDLDAAKRAATDLLDLAKAGAKVTE